MKRYLRIAVHQPNFVPWFPFFYKMAMAEHLLLLANVQFEKNGYQNRFWYKDRWITKPVHQGLEPIWEKDYIGLENWHQGEMRKWAGCSVYNLNRKWIETISATLNIKTKIWPDTPNYDSIQYKPLHQDWHDTKTGKLILGIKGLKSGAKLSGDIVYITSPEAKDKYLDEDMMRSNGIEIEYCKVPKHLQKSTFEILEEYGLQSTIRQLPRFKEHIFEESNLEKI